MHTGETYRTAMAGHRRLKPDKKEIAEKTLLNKAATLWAAAIFMLICAGLIQKRATEAATKGNAYEAIRQVAIDYERCRLLEAAGRHEEAAEQAMSIEETGKEAKGKIADDGKPATAIIDNIRVDAQDLAKQASGQK